VLRSVEERVERLRRVLICSSDSSNIHILDTGTVKLAELAGVIGAAVTGPPFVAVVPAAARQLTAATPTATFSPLAA
jgi:hypothetical protein